MLKLGSARVKMVHETGGRGQTVVNSDVELEARLDAITDDSLERYGIVLEQNLDPVETFSVGQVFVAGITATYYGRQHLAKNNRGHEV